MNIQPTYVTFEQAQFLKNLDFDLECKYYYDTEYKELTFHIGYVGDVYKNSEMIDKISAPEQWQVLEWLRVKHGIDVSILISNTYLKTKYYYFYICKDEEYDISDSDEKHSEILEKCHQNVPGNYVNHELFEIEVFKMNFGFRSPQQAYSAAFDYIFNKII